jgi:hypothetical protein
MDHFNGSCIVSENGGFEPVHAMGPEHPTAPASNDVGGHNLADGNLGRYLIFVGYLI